MFIKLVRRNEQNEQKTLVVDTNEIAFVSETQPHYDYDKPTAFEDVTDDETGETTQIATAWESEPRYVIAFKNGKHPQFLDEENYQKLIDVLLK